MSTTPRTDSIIAYLAYQFPATVGHLPLREMIGELEADAKRDIHGGRTPDPALPPLGDGPRRKMLVEIEVSADFERRLDNQWMVEREIHADRWSWNWAPDSWAAEAEVKELTGKDTID